MWNRILELPPESRLMRLLADEAAAAAQQEKADMVDDTLHTMFPEWKG